MPPLKTFQPLTEWSVSLRREAGRGRIKDKCSAEIRPSPAPPEDNKRPHREAQARTAALNANKEANDSAIENEGWIALSAPLKARLLFLTKDVDHWPLNPGIPPMAMVRKGISPPPAF